MPTIEQSIKTINNEDQLVSLQRLWQELKWSAFIFCFGWCEAFLRTSKSIQRNDCLPGVFGKWGGGRFCVLVGLLIENTSTNNGFPGRLRKSTARQFSWYVERPDVLKEQSGQKETVCRRSRKEDYQLSLTMEFEGVQCPASLFHGVANKLIIEHEMETAIDR